MITSASEFIRLRTSTEKADYDRSAHEEAPIEVWWDLVRNHPDMRSWVAHNKTVPDEILETLAGDKETDVRNVVARRRAAPPAVLERLARDKDTGVRIAVAYNPKTPRAVLEQLSRDEQPLVAGAAAARLRDE